MSRENEEARHHDCKLLSEGVSDECAVISSESSGSKVPSQKRKDEAEEIFYFARI